MKRLAATIASLALIASSAQAEEIRAMPISKSPPTLLALADEVIE
jgi:hypothetical protein